MRKFYEILQKKFEIDDTLNKMKSEPVEPEEKQLYTDNLPVDCTENDGDETEYVPFHVRFNNKLPLYNIDD